MANVSLVPVDHQPEFENVSLIPVDHDPYSADGVTQAAQLQPAQAQTVQIPTPAIGATPPAFGAPVNNARAIESGEPWNPDAGLPTSPSAPPMLPPNEVAFKPFGELKPATYTPTQRIGYLAADALMGLGMKPYFANDLSSRIGNLLGLTPLGVAGSALDLIDAKRRDDLQGVLAAASGLIPGAKGVRRGVAAEVTHHNHHPWPMYLGGAVDQQLVRLPIALHKEFHRSLNRHLPQYRGTAHYEA